MNRFFRRHVKGPPAEGETWVRCAQCRELLYVREFEKALKVCPKCGHHARLTARERIAQLADEETFVEYDAGLRSTDPLGFVSDGKCYRDRLAEAEAATGLAEAVVSGLARIDGHEVALAVCDMAFLAGSMGVVVGEKVARSAERALEWRIPLVVVAASGGARMHEGLFSLMQMAKTTTAVARLGEARLPYLAILTDPTLAGVTASFATQADVVIAEPGAYIGFAGARVIEQVTRQKLPAHLNTAEFRQAHGFVDLVVPRRDLRPTVSRLLTLYGEAPRDDRTETRVGAGADVCSRTAGR